MAVILKSTIGCLCICLLFASTNGSTSSSFLSGSDKQRLKLVFDGADLKDLNSVLSVINGYKLLGEKFSRPNDLCDFLKNSASSKDVTPVDLYHAVSAWKAVGDCPGNLQIDKTVSTLLEKETLTIPELYYMLSVAKDVSFKLLNTPKLIKLLQASLKKDDSLTNLGYTFHFASLLGVEGAFAFERIEDAIVQADEVDGRFLQFEGGLSITALIVEGAYKLATVLDKMPPITGEQAVKFANYFLSRRSVQTVKGACRLLEVITVLTNNKFHLPVAVTLASPTSVSLEQPRVVVKVSDIMGRSLDKAVLTVTAESATRMVDDVVILSKKKFEPNANDKTLYSLNLMETKPERGLYKITVSVALDKPDPRLIRGMSSSLTVKVMSAAALDKLEIGTADADHTTQPKLNMVYYPNKLATIIEADSLQKLMMRFTLKDKSTGKAMTVHQAFVRMVNGATGQEIIFVAEPDTNKQYRFDIDIGSKASEFGHMSALYAMELIVGDAVLSNSFSWRIADVRLKFGDQSEAAPVSRDQYMYKPKPEIKHVFRLPERRPPVFVSNLFTGLVAVPLLLLFILWINIGVNISNFPFSLYSFGFHLGLGGIFLLFGIFWLQLNMFQTLQYLLGIGLITFLSGNKLLASIASKRKQI